MYDYYWTHAMLSDEHHEAIVLNCNFTSEGSVTELCDESTSQGDGDQGNIFFYDIYAPLCSPNTLPPVIFCLCLLLIFTSLNILKNLMFRSQFYYCVR